MSCQLAGQPSPIHKAHETYILPVTWLVEGMRRLDAPAVPQLALPVAVAKQILALSSFVTKSFSFFL